ncbi:ABC transporter ATP-binding protein [Halocatena marina]|uniref:ABC transporter ATP-binding protein n=1 Tax=Halocatena marina TaxID=2934937 RepID=UPI0020100511|nr:ABC transporter ATP-binding protein [Halocatena marina]
MTALLNVDELRKSFGGVTAVDGASFDVEEGTVTGLIGPNGAGKTTTFNLISGFYEPDGGVISYRGTDTQEIMQPSSEEKNIWYGASGMTFGGIALSGAAYYGLATPMLAGATAVGAGIGAAVYAGQERYKEASEHTYTRPFRLANEGLVRTFQITRELKGMTVLENLMLAKKEQSGENLLNAWFRQGAVAKEESDLQQETYQMLEFLEIDHLANEEAGNLSGGQRKLVELGRVLMMEPDLILLDEPVAGVNPTLTQKLIKRIRDLRADGYTFLIVEHDMEVIMNLSDTVIVMSEGKKLMQGSPDEVQSDERVIDAYLGG